MRNGRGIIKRSSDEWQAGEGQSHEPGIDPSMVDARRNVGEEEEEDR